jgi:hypothetical protein
LNFGTTLVVSKEQVNKNPTKGEKKNERNTCCWLNENRKILLTKQSELSQKKGDKENERNTCCWLIKKSKQRH